MIATEAAARSLPDALIQQLFAFESEMARAIIMTAGSFLGLRDWTHIRTRVLLAARYAVTPIPIDLLANFFAKCYSKNLIAEALDLVIDAGKMEQWAPLYEALRAAAEGGKARLDGLAPEMRVIAVALYDQICGTNAPQPHKRIPDQLAFEKRKPSRRRTHPQTSDGVPSSGESDKARRPRNPKRA